MNFRWRTDEFQVVFSICLQGMNFWWRLDGCNVWGIYICGTRNALCLDQPGPKMCSMYCLQMSLFAPLHFNILSISSLKVRSSSWERWKIGEERGDHDVNGVKVNLCKVFWYQKGFLCVWISLVPKCVQCIAFHCLNLLPTTLIFYLLHHWKWGVAGRDESWRSKVIMMWMMLKFLSAVYWSNEH